MTYKSFALKAEFCNLRIQNNLTMFNSVFLIGLPMGSEWIIILLGVLLLFGGRKIPELMRGIGKGIREFNDAKDKVKANIEEGMRKEEPSKVENK